MIGAIFTKFGRAPTIQSMRRRERFEGQVFMRARSSSRCGKKGVSYRINQCGVSRYDFINCALPAGSRSNVSAAAFYVAQRQATVATVRMPNFIDMKQLIFASKVQPHALNIS
jgi:hypothetical protein